jgi:hypothetical protein
MNANGLYSGLELGTVNGVYNGVNSGVGNGAVSNETKRLNPLILDLFPGAAAAYSLRKLRTSYNGSCIRIRRSSDNAETDIGFVNNYVDTNEVERFTGSGAGAFVVTWYDQSGNGRNATQSTAASQPLLMALNFEFATIDATATAEKAIIFNQLNWRLISNFTTISQPISAFTYGRKDNVTTALAGVYYDSYNNTESILLYSGTNELPNNRWGIGTGTALYGTTSGNTNPNLFSTLHNGASSSIHINGQSYASGNAGTNGLNGLAIGNLRGNPSPIAGSYQLNGRIAELIIYGSDQSLKRTSIEKNINNYYRIY